MQYKKKAFTAAIIAFLVFSMALTIIPMASAAGAITLTPTAQAPGASVSVAGTSFGATKAVGIGFGTEVTVTGEATPTPTGSGTGPYTTRLAHYPIKPGSFSMHSDVSGTESDWTDNGDGTITGSGTYAAEGNVNYVTGVFGRSSTADISSYTIVFTASYTYYTYNVTSAAGVTTSASGAFTASITVPTVANGNYNVTAIDAGGNRATATLNVNSAIPEGFTIGVIVLLSAVAVIAGSRCFRKQSKTENGRSMKLIR